MRTSRSNEAAAEAGNTNEWSTLLPHTERSDRGPIRRSFDPSVHPELGVNGCRTLYETIRHGAAVNPLGPCLGFRAVSTSGLATPFIYSSYSEILARAESFAAGLDALGLVPPNDEDNLKLIGLYLPNCVEWILAEHAIFTVGGGAFCVGRLVIGF